MLRHGLRIFPIYIIANKIKISPRIILKLHQNISKTLLSVMTQVVSWVIFLSLDSFKTAVGSEEETISYAPDCRSLKRTELSIKHRVGKPAPTAPAASLHNKYCLW